MILEDAIKDAPPQSINIELSKEEKESIQSWEPCSAEDFDANTIMSSITFLLYISNNKDAAFKTFNKITNYSCHSYMPSTSVSTTTLSNGEVQVAGSAEMVYEELNVLDTLFCTGIISKDFDLPLIALKTGLDFSKTSKKNLPMHMQSI